MHGANPSGDWYAPPTKLGRPEGRVGRLAGVKGKTGMRRSQLVLGGAIAIALAFGATTPASLVADSASYLDPARAWAGGWGLSEIDGPPPQGRLPAHPFALGLLIRLFGESR